MTEHAHTMSRSLEILFLALQALQVFILWTHDLVPLGRFNDVAAVKSQDTTARLAIVTLVQSLPFTVGLIFCLRYFGQPYPHRLVMWLWYTYGAFLVGYLFAWWIPYLFGGNAERVARYRIMFSKTHTFLPERHGIFVNTLHVALHTATLATVVILFLYL